MTKEVISQLSDKSEDKCKEREQHSRPALPDVVDTSYMTE